MDADEELKKGLMRFFLALSPAALLVPVAMYLAKKAAKEVAKRMGGR